VIFAGGVVAAEKYRPAFVAVPAFWSVWMLQALMADLDSVKFAVYARWLEQQVNEALGVTVFGWEGRMADRANFRRPLVFQVSYVSWVLLNSGAWGAAVWILFDQKHEVWAWVAIASAVAFFGVGAWTLVTRPRYERRCLERLSEMNPV
jgi:hypothetical protein